MGINFCSWQGSCSQTCHEGAATNSSHYMKRNYRIQGCTSLRLTAAGDKDLDDDLQNIPKTKKIVTQ